jgi:hypothetical protein
VEWPGFGLAEEPSTSAGASFSALRGGSGKLESNSTCSIMFIFDAFKDTCQNVVSQGTQVASFDCQVFLKLLRSSFRCHFNAEPIFNTDSVASSRVGNFTDFSAM